MKMTMAVLAALTAACSKRDADPAYLAEIDAWHKERVEHLTAPTGWLTLVGLHWLKEGPNPIEGLGTFTRAGGSVWLDSVRLFTDADSEPTVIERGTISFFAIRRGERIGLRVRDSEHPARKKFRGIERWPVDASWRFEARFEPYLPPRTIAVPNVLGDTSSEPCPGALVFEKDGATYRLDPVLEGDELFLIFGDRTNGKESYGAGRFLYTSLPKDGRVVLDFNKAYNPPCAFTPFATCPLPPAQNRLAMKVGAGEKNYAH